MTAGRNDAILALHALYLASWREDQQVWESALALAEEVLRDCGFDLADNSEWPTRPGGTNEDV